MKKLFIIAHALLSFPAYSMEEASTLDIAVKKCEMAQEEHLKERDDLLKFSREYIKTINDLSTLVSNLRFTDNHDEAERIARQMSKLTQPLNETYFATLKSHYDYKRTVAVDKLSKSQKKVDEAVKAVQSILNNK